MTRQGPKANPVVAPPWVFIANPDHNNCWLRCDMSVIEVECPECNALRGAPCYYPEETRETFRVYQYGTVHKPETRFGRHKSASHKARQVAATARRNGRAKIGLPYTLEVDFIKEKVKINLMVPNFVQASREEQEAAEKAELQRPATKGEVQEIKDRLDKIEGI